MAEAMLWSPGASALLRTKLHRPRVPASTVARPRLWHMLDDGISHHMVLITAPSGYGKTTLVSSWLDHFGANAPHTMPAAWLTLDEGDQNLPVILRYVCAALETIFPDSFTLTRSLLAAPSAPSSAELVTSLSNEIASLPEDCVLVMDDVHTLSETTITEFLGALLRHWPERLHLVLISRYPPSLPLVSVRARGQLSELTSSDLRFNHEETGQYVQRVFEAPPDPALVSQLDGRMEGWIAGMHLALFSQRRNGVQYAVNRGASAERDIHEYLIQDALAKEPPDLLEFLMTISILNRFCLPLCEALMNEAAGAGQAAVWLNWLVRNEFFTLALDDERHWFRLHRLLRDALVQRANALFSQEQICALHEQAAHWLADHGWLDEALRHAMTCNNLTLAASIALRGFRDLLNQEDRTTLNDWLGQFPESFIAQHPGLLIMRAMSLMLAWRVTELGPVLDRFDGLLAGDSSCTEGSELESYRGMALTLRSLLASARNQPEASVELARDGLALVRAEWTYVRGGAVIYLANGLQALGQSDAISQQLLQEYEALPDKENTYAQRLLLARALCSSLDGRLEDTRQTAALMRDLSGGLALMQGWAHCLLGQCFQDWNDLAQASTAFQAVAESRLVVNTYCARTGLQGLAVCLSERGEFSEARTILGELSALDTQTYGVETAETQALRAWLQARQGDLTSALRWAEAFPPAEPGRQPIWVIDPQLTRASLLLLRGTDRDNREACAHLVRLEAYAKRNHNVRYQIQAGVYRSIAEQACGDSVTALDTLRRIVELARPGGFVRPFLEPGLPVRVLLDRLAAREPMHHDVQRLRSILARQSATAASRNTAQRFSATPEPLTPREIDVLALIRERFSDKEIALQLGISPGTVKRHSANLFEKLAVNKRWDAVARAEEFGLLPPRTTHA